MGLDSYFANEDWPEDEEGKMIVPEMEDADDIALVGGILSGHGVNGSFRGKVYNEYVQDVTGESLYQERVPNDVVRQMADALEAYEWGGDEDYWRPEDAEEADALARVFRHFADEGAELWGWW